MTDLRLTKNEGMYRAIMSELLDFARNHYYLKDDEMAEIDRIDETFNALVKSGKGLQDQLELIAQLQSIQSKLIERESTVSERQKEITVFGKDLNSVEKQMLFEINPEREKQYSNSKFILWLVFLVVILISIISVRLVFQPQVQLGTMGVQVATLLSLTSIIYFFLRLYQNAREATERMDEKAVAIKFMRYAFRIMMNNPGSEKLVEYAVKMFLGHYAPSSATLSDKEYRDFVQSMVRVGSVREQSSEESGNTAKKERAGLLNGGGKTKGSGTYKGQQGR